MLVEGDDTNEPISDTVRGILDGHIVLNREIANRGRYPAIDILKSISRTMPRCNTDEQNELINKAKQIMATYEDMAEIIRIGAYKKGSDANIDNAIHYYDRIERFLSQKINESVDFEECYSMLAGVLSEAPIEENPSSPES